MNDTGETFNSWDYQGLDHPVCPSCGEEISDVHNGGDPRAWWCTENMPDGNLKHECGKLREAIQNSRQLVARLHCDPSRARS